VLGVTPTPSRLTFFEPETTSNAKCSAKRHMELSHIPGHASRKSTARNGRCESNPASTRTDLPAESKTCAHTATVIGHLTQVPSSVLESGPRRDAVLRMVAGIGEASAGISFVAQQDLSPPSPLSRSRKARASACSFLVLLSCRPQPWVRAMALATTL